MGLAFLKAIHVQPPLVHPLLRAVPLAHRVGHLPGHSLGRHNESGVCSGRAVCGNRQRQGGGVLVMMGPPLLPAPLQELRRLTYTAEGVRSHWRVKRMRIFEMVGHFGNGEKNGEKRHHLQGVHDIRK